MPNHRPAAVAGSFYPADPRKLASTVDRLMSRATAALDASAGINHCPKALIVPHAGYHFSGAIAAEAYAHIQTAAATIRRVVLFGPSHKVRVPGMALPRVTAFDTPLGSVQLDRDNLEALRGLDYCVEADEPHAKEHSLEVQLPFLQKLLPEIQLTPVAIGTATRDQIASALDRVWGGPETLILISSDLSHYNDYDESQRLDEKSSRSIMSLLANQIQTREACGWRGVNGLLQQAARKELIPTTLNVLNSGDTTRKQDRVVGYGAWAFSHEPVVGFAPLNPDEESALLQVARKTIARAADGATVPKVNVGSFAAALQRPGAAFITLKKNGRLRACMGSLRAYRPLVMDVVERSHCTATRDPRVPKIEREELRSLYLEIASLTAPVELKFSSAGKLLEQLRPRLDGLTIEDKGYRATFLPKVWEEIREPGQFLARLRRKAGLPEDHWSPTFRAWKYRAQCFGAPFVAR